MSHSLNLLYIHYIYSTKYRKPLIHEKFEHKLWAYKGSIAKQHSCIPIAIGGVEDHVHCLIRLSPRMNSSKLVQLIKGGSSKWVNDLFFPGNNFRWQKGCGAFTVSPSGVQKLSRYIHNQKIHHKKVSFQKEFTWFLDRYNMDYDSETLFG
jgi:putative transposase